MSAAFVLLRNGYYGGGGPPDDWILLGIVAIAVIGLIVLAVV